MSRGRPTERETLLDPTIMVMLETYYPKRSAFAALANVSPQTLHRMLNQQPCHAWEVEAVERTYTQCHAKAVNELLNTPYKELTSSEHLRLRSLVAELYPLALGTTLGGKRVTTATKPPSSLAPPPCNLSPPSPTDDRGPPKPRNLEAPPRRGKG